MAPLPLPSPSAAGEVSVHARGRTVCGLSPIGVRRLDPSSVPRPLGRGGLLPVAGPLVRGTSAGRDTEPMTRDR
jgi:hypothetical protein